MSPLSRAWEFTVEQVGGDTGRNLPTEAHKQATREFRWENPQAQSYAPSVELEPSRASRLHCARTAGERAWARNRVYSMA